ncbi:MAG: adenylosuccinate synthase [Armatimonadetes bacterium]|nr:adenylosuccinate synthase [Armatimonadota bacterium]
MANIAVLGCMFGDEAKAKIVDVLAANADIVVRFQGGNNAGHTIILNSKKYIFKLVPSGILYPDKMCAIGSGLVVDPFRLLEEMQVLENNGVSFKNRFFIDPRTQVVLPLHKELDAKHESNSQQTKIGTTKRGIGPCYTDMIARFGIRFSDLFDKEYLLKRMQNLYSFHNLSLDKIEETANSLIAVGEKLKPFMKQIPYLLNDLSNQKKIILFEGAQGSLLDIVFGTYPFVTSSHTISGSISIGCGFSPQKIDKIMGVYKSYFTRVGEGPFPTELNNEIGEQIRKQGNEYGSVTGRPRRCGWFDAVAAKFAAMINGVDEIAFTLLDVLSGLKTIKICTQYKSGDEILEEFPYSTNVLKSITPEYIELPGWNDDISNIKEFDQLPENAQKYVLKIEELLDTKISIISVGPERNQTIFRK